MKLQTKNTLWSVVQHLATILCGLILPREILAHYGSEMNGMLYSVSQFLFYTVLLDFGISAVIPAALYRPLAEGNREKVSQILSSGSRVYRKIALACAAYILLLAWLFPGLSGIRASLQLIFVLGIGTAAHYAAGLPERLLIISDQKGYVTYRLGTATVLLSTALQVLLIRGGNSLAAVKLAGTAVSILEIAGILLYAKRHYAIDRKIQYTEEPISQKWNGIAQHVAYFILENTDIILLSLFAGFREVSVYSVYFLVVSGIRQIFNSVSASVQPKLGELAAKGDQQELNRFFGSFERWIHLSAALAFGILGLLLVPFVQAYTEGVADANYVRPVFAALMAAAYGTQCVRDVYDKLILASGHFKQTQKNYMIAAGLNLGISLAVVPFFGPEGAAAGTLAAMVYQLAYMAWYDSKVLLKRPVRAVLQNLLLDAAIVAVLICMASWIRLPVGAWFRTLLSIIRP